MSVGSELKDQFGPLEAQIERLMKREILPEKDAIELCNTVFIK